MCTCMAFERKKVFLGLFETKLHGLTAAAEAAADAAGF